MSFRAWKRHFRIVEIPIVFVDRTEGQSKMSRSIVREAIWMVWRLRLWALTGKISRAPARTVIAAGDAQRAGQ
jgi:dolichol-phosphate mannosyltransferase